MQWKFLPLQVLLKAFILLYRRSSGARRFITGSGPFGIASGIAGKGGRLLEEKGNKVKEIKDAKESMLLQLEQMRQSGVALFVDGRAALPNEAVSKAVRENSPYMADYVMSPSGTIEQVRFDRVTRW